MFMSQMQELVELKALVHALRQSAAEGRSAHDLAQLDHALARIDAGLYPLCETCGARIEMDRLRVTPQATQCRICAPDPAQS
jgi:RNA polymerase-binding transcription factor DksA